MHINEGKDKLALVLFAAAVIVLVPLTDFWRANRAY